MGTGLDLYISPSVCCFALCCIHFLFVAGVNLWVIMLGSWKRRLMVDGEEGGLFSERLWSLVKEGLLQAPDFHMDYLTLFVWQPPPSPLLLHEPNCLKSPKTFEMITVFYVPESSSCWHLNLFFVLSRFSCSQVFTQSIFSSLNKI